MRLYDSLARDKRNFVPIIDGEVSMYVCGATPQSGPHPGHMRAGVVFDTLRRWLEATGLRVTFVRNITDIDDKIIVAADRDETVWWRVVEKNVVLFNEAYSKLNVLPPSIEPRATAHIPEIEMLIRRLIELDAAYVTETGSVYLSVDKLDKYGILSGQKPADLQSGEPDDWTAEKRSPLDFALWKASKPGEPSWPMWIAQEGRPGWHIECTAMATKYLGGNFDIHGGGLDLTFPHHENEIAQAQAAGLDYANYWLHNGLIQVDNQKMGKSLGNSVTVDALFDRVSPMQLRYYLLSAHYRSPLNFSFEGLDGAVAAYERIEQAVAKTAGFPAATILSGQYVSAFTEAMEDDLNTPKAYAALQSLAKDILASDEGVADFNEKAEAFNLMTSVLGIAAELDQSADKDVEAASHEAAIERLTELRASLRASGSYVESDEIRSILELLGATVKDTKA